MEPDLWTWAVEAYARPGVQALCLELQDAHAQSVPLLLWAGWAEGGDPPTVARAAALCRQWEGEVTGRLRAVRRALKPAHHLVDDVARERLRLDVKLAELAAERLLLDSLQAMTPVGSRHPAATLLERLRGAAQAFGHSAPDAMLADLAGRLAAPAVESSTVLL